MSRQVKLIELGFLLALTAFLEDRLLTVVWQNKCTVLTFSFKLVELTELFQSTLISAVRVHTETGLKITGLELTVGDRVVRFGSQDFGVAGLFSQCAFASLVW
jgi:hypothetical protein